LNSGDIICGANGKAKVIEVNAFGDLLPHVTFNGQSTYESQVSLFGARI